MRICARSLLEEKYMDNIWSVPDDCIVTILKLKSTVYCTCFFQGWDDEDKGKKQKKKKNQILVNFSKVLHLCKILYALSGGCRVRVSNKTKWIKNGVMKLWY